MSAPVGIPARLWVGDLGEGDVEMEDKAVAVEVDASEKTIIALHTMIDGTGSHASYYLDREHAIALAGEILQAVRIDG